MRNKLNLAFETPMLSLLLVVLLASLAVPQEASSTSSPSAQQSIQQTSSSTAKKHRHTPFDDFLIRGTVFGEKALAFPGVDIRIRRVGEKKFHWQDVTNSRGDFAIRVPYDATYEVVTHAKGFQEQSKTVDAKAGAAEQNLSFQMEPVRGKK
jgi:Carboxypeptidase regulatory-like domain